ncbi:MAG TPA: formimidoylglutamase [Gemmatimonadales bacterium]|nr:formimidoylglutamase [Gemmatimonadales bacterium]
MSGESAPRFVPPDYAPPRTAADDPRIGQLIGRGLAGGAAPRVVIVGFPSDEGVRRNGGRPGAADAPQPIRRALGRLTPDARCWEAMAELFERTLDLGDLELTGDLERDQATLAAVLAPHLRAGAFAIVLGGGHETAYGHFLAHAGLGRTLSLLNWDAHADVRPLRDGRGHSGSPFRQALDHPSRACRSYTVVGLQPQALADAHLAFLRARGCRPVWRSRVTLERVGSFYDELVAPALVSFDLDAVDQAFAPGVSAPCTGGFGVDVWREAAYHAGRSAAVVGCDIVELNPRHDRDDQTARLAALTVWEVVRGMAER